MGIFFDLAENQELSTIYIGEINKLYRFSAGMIRLQIISQETLLVICLCHILNEDIYSNLLQQIEEHLEKFPIFQYNNLTWHNTRHQHIWSNN